MQSQEREREESGNFYEGKTILVTGGAGSIGSRLVKQLLEYPIHSIRVFDHDEYGMFKLQRELAGKTQLRFLLGDIKDQDRCRLLVRDADIIIHLAALKNLELTEYNLPDLIQTNILGTLHLARAAIYEEPQIFCNVSTDKCVYPISAYGCSKLMSEYIIKWLNVAVKPLKAYSVRLGNVRPTKGSVWEIWEEQKAQGKELTVTDPKAQRYFIDINDAVKFIIKSLAVSKGGDIVIPKIPLYSMEAFLQNCRYKIIGLRPNEKKIEQLMTEEEREKAKDFNDYWVIE